MTTRTVTSSSAANAVCAYCGIGAPAEKASDAPLVCPRCGAVRLPNADATDAQRRAADNATVHRTSAGVWKAFGLSALGFAALSLLVVWSTMSVADPPLVANVVAFAGALVPAAFGVRALGRSRAERAAMVPSVNAAFGSTTARNADVPADGGVTPQVA